MRRSIIWLLLLTLTLSLFATAAAAKTWTIVNVPKVSGIAWFDRMNEGVKRFAEDTGHNAYQVGPSAPMQPCRCKLLKTSLPKV